MHSLMLKKLSNATALPAFTLAELLVALLILAEIATFTIPKVLSANQIQTWKTGGKEAAATMAQAYHLYKLRNGITSGTKFNDFISYLNYVKEDTSGADIDHRQGLGLTSCPGTVRRCFVMHSGGVIHYQPTVTFGGTASTNAIGFMFDPDPANNSTTTNAPGKAVQFYIYTTGRVTTIANLEAGTANNSGPVPAVPDGDPPWFGW